MTKRLDSVTMGGVFSNGSLGPDVGSSLGASAGNAVSSGDGRWPPPAWKLGLRLSDDRGGI